MFRFACLLALLAVLTAAPAGAQGPRPLGAPTPLQAGDAFGETVELPERTLVFIQGDGTWDKAFATLVEAFKKLNAYLAKQNIKPSGAALTIYTETSDTGFKFQAALPVAETPKGLPSGGIDTTKAPSGKALKFTHRGSYDAMDSTYEAITNYLDEKRLEAKDMFIEEYAGDPAASTGDKLVVTVFVPVK